MKKTTSMLHPLHATVSRRTFIRSGIFLIVLPPLVAGNTYTINTVNGRLPCRQMGTTLVHEHFLVDFIGADKITTDRWKREDVLQRVLPFIQEAKKAGVRTMLDCTPAFLGRDVQLLKMLAEASGINIITNTGYYGAVSNKYLPAWAFTETAEQLAQRWINEFNDGIDGTDVRPGFMKISVDEGSLSPLHTRLITAAGITHLQTGLTICSHTGPAVPAFQQLEVLQQMGVHPSAFVWTHAQNEPDKQQYIKAAKMGAWVSLDGIGWGNIMDDAKNIAMLHRQGLLNRVLISHDAGWYKPGEPNGGSFKGYTVITGELTNQLKQLGLTNKHLKQLLQQNPAEAFGIRVRKLS